MEHMNDLRHANSLPAKGLRRLFVRPAEAAIMLAISRSKLYEMMLSGELPFVTIGSMKRIPLRALEALVEITA
jgi:excisionase family DNA binding protein